MRGSPGGPGGSGSPLGLWAERYLDWDTKWLMTMKPAMTLRIWYRKTDTNSFKDGWRRGTSVSVDAMADDIGRWREASHFPSSLSIYISATVAVGMN